MKFLFNNRQSRLFYIFKATFLAVLSSVAVSTFLYFTVGLSAGDPDSFLSPTYILLTIFAAPLIENLLLVFLLFLIGLIKRSLWLQSFFGALVFAILHSSARWSWGFSIFFSFLIFSLSYLAWKEKGKIQAFFISVGIHALNNAFACLVVYLAVILKP